MSKNDIRLRKQKLTDHGIDRFRNYGAVLKRHQERNRLKRLLRMITYFLIIMIFAVIILVVWMEHSLNNAKKEKPVATSATAKSVDVRHFKLTA